MMQSNADLLLPLSLPLEAQRSLAWLRLVLLFFSSVDMLSPKQLPCPKLIMYFPVTFAFTLQIVFDQMCPGPPRQVC